MKFLSIYRVEGDICSFLTYTGWRELYVVLNIYRVEGAICSFLTYTGWR